jgi:hypothetical protein
LILDSAESLVETAYFQGTKIHIPDSIVDFLQPNIFACTNGRNLDPVGAPTNSSAGIDVTGLIPIGIDEGRIFRGMVRGERE